jgi:hypothetical protein
MRLLLRSNIGEFSFTKGLDGDDTIPPYAILSHTWLPDTEEPTFEDLTNGTGEEKLGYKKIRSCGEQARRDGLHTSGWTHVASTRQTTPNSRRLSTPCFAGTATRVDATSIYQMSPSLPSAPMMSSIHSRGTRIFGKANGSLGVGRSKSFLHLLTNTATR